jgi:hypothetical protein
LKRILPAVGRTARALSDRQCTGLRHSALSKTVSSGENGHATLERFLENRLDQTMKLRIKLERQKIARGHQAGRAQVVQADQRTQRERDRGASKRAILRRELDDR